MDYPRITKSQVKFIQSLKQKKFRQKYNKYTIESHKIISELLIDNENLIDVIIGTDEYLQSNQETLDRFNVEVWASSIKNIEIMSQLKSPTNVLALCSESSDMNIKGEIKTGKYLYLENIQNPGNVGTMFRTADWFGYDGILFNENPVEVYNQKVLQSSMGSVFRVPHAILSDIEFASIKLPKIATTLNGEDLRSFEFPNDFILCLGHEGQGLRKETMDKSDFQVSIQGKHKKGAESLNVAISSSIFMFQSVK